MRLVTREAWGCVLALARNLIHALDLAVAVRVKILPQPPILHLDLLPFHSTEYVYPHSLATDWAISIQLSRDFTLHLFGLI